MSLHGFDPASVLFAVRPVAAGQQLPRLMLQPPFPEPSPLPCPCPPAATMRAPWMCGPAACCSTSSAPAPTPLVSRRVFLKCWASSVLH